MKKVDREGKIFVDWSQNHQRKTTVAVYSLRAREKQTASTPVTWDEVAACAESGNKSELTFAADAVIERIGETRRPLRAGARARTGAAGPLAMWPRPAARGPGSGRRPGLRIRPG